MSKLEKEVATLMQQTETEEMVVRKQRRTKEQQEAYEQARCVSHESEAGRRLDGVASTWIVVKAGGASSEEEAEGGGRVSCARRVASRRSF